MTFRASIAVLGVMLVGCNAAGAVPSEPTASASQPFAPGGSPTSPPSPTPSGTPLPGMSTTAEPAGDLHAAWQTVRVRVNGLAVRAGPASTYPLVAGYRWDTTSNGEVHVTDAVRVDDGYFLWIEAGPLVIQGVPWYRVGNSARQTDLAPDDTLRWDADGDESRFDYGWVAGGDGSSLYLVPDDPPPPPPDEPVYGGAPDPFAILSGIGDSRSESFEPGTSTVGISWYAADPEGDSCSLTITLEPVGIVMVSAEIDGWDGGADFWPEDVETPIPSELWVNVETDCSWALLVQPIIG